MQLGKIAQIKITRHLTGLTLVEAKWLVEKYNDLVGRAWDGIMRTEGEMFKFAEFLSRFTTKQWALVPAPGSSSTPGFSYIIVYTNTPILTDSIIMQEIFGKQN